MEPKRNKNYIAGIYLRLSRDDERAGESFIYRKSENIGYKIRSG